ncbi:hypothetical protein [Oceanobacillus salinisoli]|uniref:hypothetical protein n=1 Tax=Oceanobacillus salinisoli TaxID=2678611 RepID=UPI0012E2CDFF|nr:hypothetical protein [Oceanobacillus salinisoli]
MKKIITFIVSLSVMLLMISGCTEEGKSIDGQKQIQFSLSQKGSNENWEVTDKITGEYYNLEKLVQSTHEIKIVPKGEVDYKSLTLSLKIGDEIIGFYEENKEGETLEFNVELTEEGYYQVTQGSFVHFNENNTFWGEDITIVIEYGDKKEEIKLG